ncbi:hypothetical protein B0H17DRAFT_1150195 [Mycena rosella]|uniref:Uncharacterized protein n=1 Tax=Mycena rosella TaxID=1033263 RepID=A0AAD7FQ50_MYCRO|nr:hypothetical protein B0H17DRAFT_1150195 [Mycena rosella]
MSHLQGHPTAVHGTSHGFVWDIPSIEVGHPTIVMGCPMSHSLPQQRHIPTGNTETFDQGARCIFEQGGAYLSKAKGGGAFKGGRRRHIPMGNAEAHLTRVLGAYLSKAEGGGPFKDCNAEVHLTRALDAYLSKAVGGRTFKGGRWRHITTGNAEYFFITGYTQL